MTSVIWSHCPAQVKNLKVDLNWDSHREVRKDFLGELFHKTGGERGTTEVRPDLCCASNLSHLKTLSIASQIHKM